MDTRHHAFIGLAFTVPLLTLTACSLESDSTGPEDRNPPPPDPASLQCDIDSDAFVDGGTGIGAIPALDNPDVVFPGEPGTEYLDTPDDAGTANIRDHDRVIVFRMDGGWVAVPHNILWWHEIAHFTGDQRQFAVTYCPLTGSSLVFSHGEVSVSRFQVSGLLFNNNLVMRDPETGSLWPQMLLRAGCGPKRGRDLPVIPSLDTRWERWKELHPDTRVVSSRTGFDRDYDQYPYGGYEVPNSPPLASVDHLDRRRPLKERILGIPAGDGGIAYPFGELSGGSGIRVVHDTVGGESLVLFWDEQALTAAAYEPSAGSQELEFEVRDGAITDIETGSTWTYDGVATSGPLEGERLRPREKAYVAFWFAWAVFQPETEIWTSAAEGSSGS